MTPRQPPGPRTVVAGIGCATPAESATQAQAVKFAIDVADLSGDTARFAETVYRRSGVSTRSSALLDSTGAADLPLDQAFFHKRGFPTDGGPSTGDRMHAYSNLAPALAITAAMRALADAGSPTVTHLITVSCTGFMAPGVDIALMQALGLDPGVERLNIGFMGCHGGIIGLRTARAMVEAAPGPAIVLVVCVELCSLHMQYSERPDQIVANALFGDGAAALVVTSEEVASPSPGPLRVIANAGRVFPDTLGAMGWSIGDHGFEMTLAESVPELIRMHLRPWLGAWLKSCGVEQAFAELDWVVHPGGPRVVRAVGEAMGLTPETLAPSLSVLNDYGNMSSPTVVFILERVLKLRGAGPVIMLGFGPGLSVEAALLEYR